MAIHFQSPNIYFINDVTVNRQFAAHSPHKRHTSELSISGSEEENPQTNICFKFSFQAD